MSQHDVRATLGAILVGSGIASMFVIRSLPPGAITGLMAMDWGVQLDRGRHHADGVLLPALP